MTGGVLRLSDRRAPRQPTGDRDTDTILGRRLPGTRAQRGLAAAFLVLVTALISLANPRQVGDGREYVAQAFRMSRLAVPAVSEIEADRIDAEIDRVDPDYQTGLGGVLHEQWRGSDGRYEMSHFWLYSALAVPGVWTARLVGFHPHYAFTIVNVSLLLVALWLAVPRIRAAPTALLFGSPLLWWIDKAHPEVFTFSLFAIALLLFEDRPWWSLVALGAVGAQNPPFAPALVVAVVLIAYRRRGSLGDRRLWVGAAAGGALALLHPLYYWWRLGRPYPQAGWGSETHVPSIAEIGSVIWDPNIGLLVNFPLLGPLLVFALVVIFLRARRSLLRPSLVLGAATAAIVLVVVAQTVNHNSGGTRNMTRYAVWILPFVAPFFALALGRLRGRLHHVFAGLVALSLVLSVYTDRPSTGAVYTRPTPLAEYLWTNHPGWHNPIAEIFSERVRGFEVRGHEPAATSGCEKVLTVAGRWPDRCPRPSGGIPEPCTEKGALCYANRSDDGYGFVGAPR